MVDGDDPVAPAGFQEIVHQPAEIGSSAACFCRRPAVAQNGINQAVILLACALGKCRVHHDQVLHDPALTGAVWLWSTRRRTRTDSRIVRINPRSSANSVLAEVAPNGACPGVSANSAAIPGALDL